MPQPATQVGDGGCSVCLGGHSLLPPPHLTHTHTHTHHPTHTGTFAWVGVPLKAGARCMLAYNCRSGPLGFTNSAKLHLGYDGWYNKEKQVWGGGGGGRGRSLLAAADSHHTHTHMHTTTMPTTQPPPPPPPPPKQPPDVRYGPP
jgi:hypothetical protein